MQIYAVGLAPERALMIAQNALFGGRLTVEEIQSRVVARLPRAQPLPGRPQLDKLIKSLGLEMEWKATGTRVQEAREHVEPAPTAIRNVVHQRLKMKSRPRRSDWKLPGEEVFRPQKREHFSSLNRLSLKKYPGLDSNQGPID